MLNIKRIDRVSNAKIYDLTQNATLVENVRTPPTEVSGPCPQDAWWGAMQGVRTVYSTTWEEKTRKATNPVSQIHSTPFGRHRQHDWPGQAVWIGRGSLWLEEARSRLLCSQPMMMMIAAVLVKRSIVCCSRVFCLGNRPWSITEKTVCGYTAMQLKIVFCLYCIYLYLSVYMYLFILFVIFIYSFTVLLPSAGKCTWNCGTCTYIHDECPPDWERCPQYEGDCPCPTNHCKLLSQAA